MKKLIFVSVVLFCSLCAAQNECPATSTLAGTGKDSSGNSHQTQCTTPDGKLLLPTAIVPNLNNVFYVDGHKYPTSIAGIQSALTAAENYCATFGQVPPGTNTPPCEVVIPPGVYSGITGISYEGVYVHAYGAVLNFSNLPSTTNAVTVTCSGTFADRTGLFGAEIMMNNSGQDGVHVNCGQHGILKDLNIVDFGRDALNFTPDANWHWIEDWTIDNLRTFICSSGCSETPSANLRDAIHIEIPNLTGIFANGFNFKGSINVRGYGNAAMQLKTSGRQSGETIGGVNCTDCNFDAGNGMLAIAGPGTNSVVLNDTTSSYKIFNITFIGGGMEDTATRHSVPGISVPNAASVKGFTWINPAYSNFSGQYIDNPGNVTNLTIDDQNAQKKWGCTDYFASKSTTAYVQVCATASAPSGSCFGSNPLVYLNTAGTTSGTVVYVCTPGNNWSAITAP